MYVNNSIKKRPLKREVVFFQKQLPYLQAFVALNMDNEMLSIAANPSSRFHLKHNYFSEFVNVLTCSHDAVMIYIESGKE